MGNYWDWTIPYFSNHTANYFQNQSLSWLSSVDLGHPLGYISGLYFNYLVSLNTYLKPEHWFSILFILIFGLSFIFLNKILKVQVDRWLALLLALAAIFNPAIFYKLLAGHLGYLVSFPIFIYLIYFVLCKLENNFKSYLILGLILAFVGVEIQFFIIAAIFLMIFFLFTREKFSLKYLGLLILVPFLINLPWLSNFLVGANSVGASSSGATVMLFNDAAFCSLKRIFFMIFAPATDIQFVYSRIVLAYFGIFSAMTALSIILYYFFINRSPKSQVRSPVNVLVANLVVFTLLGTGYFQKIPIPILKTFYPMFRESGHFAPVIILFEILVLALTLPAILNRIRNPHLLTRPALGSGGVNLLTYSLTAYLLIFIGINAYTFYKYLPRVDFAAAREQFQPFENFGATDNSTYRVLSYPFWEQYGFINQPDLIKDGKLLNNSGWDSFVNLSGKDSISNYQAGGQSIDDTLQYRLLTTGNLTELEQKNVKYIYDLSGIYTSNWDIYTSADTYNNDLSLIKNDPNFIAKLIAANPGKITKVAKNIYKLNYFLPRIYAQSTVLSPQYSAKLQASFTKINSTEYKISVKNLSSTAELNYLENFHPGWKLYLGDYKLLARPLFDAAHTEKFGYANSWMINKDDIIKQAKYFTTNSDGSINADLTLYFQPQTPFSVGVTLSILTILGSLSFLLYSAKSHKNK